MRLVMTSLRAYPDKHQARFALGLRNLCGHRGALQRSFARTMLSLPEENGLLFPSRHGPFSLGPSVFTGGQYSSAAARSDLSRRAPPRIFPVCQPLTISLSIRSYASEA